MVNLQRRASIFMAMAMLLAGIASVWTYHWLQRVETELRHEIQETNRSQSVVVASEDIPAGTAISAESVRLVSLPVETIPDGVLDDVSRVSGRIVVAQLRRNEPVLEAKLAPVDVTRGGIATLTGQDKRAIAVHVDEVVAVAGFIQPGDRVDVLATLHTDDDKNRPVTKIILENVPVLATGGNAGDTPKGSLVGHAEGPHVMTLEVSPDEAEKLTLAASEGRIHLVLRHPLNREKTNTEGATVEGLLGRSRGEGVPAPDRLVVRKDKQASNEFAPRVATKDPDTASTNQHKAPPSVSSVEVIRGLQRSEVRFVNTSQSEPADEHAR
jgi:pilus assembly protein CpaB